MEVNDCKLSDIFYCETSFAILFFASRIYALSQICKRICMVSLFTCI